MIDDISIYSEDVGNISEEAYNNHPQVIYANRLADIRALVIDASPVLENLQAKQGPVDDAEWAAIVSSYMQIPALLSLIEGIGKVVGNDQ